MYSTATYATNLGPNEMPDYLTSHWDPTYWTLGEEFYQHADGIWKALKWDGPELKS